VSGHLQRKLGWFCVAATLPLACQGETTSPRSIAAHAPAEPAAVATLSPTPPPDVRVSNTPNEPPFLTLWQRDDRDVIGAEAFRPSRVAGEVVLVRFRQPNRHHEAGFVVLLDERSPGTDGPPRGAPFVLPARDTTPIERPPALQLLEAFGDPQGTLWVTDLVPSEDPLGTAMVGKVHQLRLPNPTKPAGKVVTQRMAPPPAGFRWAGPELVSVVDGQLTVVLAPTTQALVATLGTAGGQLDSADADAGEAVFQPRREVCGATPLGRFLATKRSPDRYRSWFQSPKHPLRGSTIVTETTCDREGCQTTLRRDASSASAPRIAAHVPGNGTKQAPLRGPDHTPPQGVDGSGSLQQRTPIE
jgi:hypothetical protein